MVPCRTSQVPSSSDADWARADELRDEIDRAGYVVEDTAEGPVARKKK